MSPVSRSPLTKRIKRRLSVLVLVLAFASPAWGQGGLYTLSLHSGYTVPNSEEWNYIAGGSIGADFSVSRRIDWGFCDTNCYFPVLRNPYWMGLRGGFTYFPNDIAGQRISFSGFIQQPLFYFNRFIRLDGDSTLVSVREPFNLDLDFGLAFYTNPYCRTPNPDNVFIGSYANCMIQLGFSQAFTLKNSSKIVLGAKFAHSSNGYLRKPNKGLNYLQLSLGYSLPVKKFYGKIYESKFDTIPETCTAYCPVMKWPDMPVDNPAFRGGDILLSYAPGIVMPRYTGASSNYFYAHTARVGYLYRLSPARAVGATLDLTYNYSHTAVIAHWHEDYNLPFYVGLAAAYEASFHRLTLHTAVAAYLCRSEHGTTPLYERVGLFYNFGPEYRRLRHFVGVSLKSHMAHIDFIEWHYGIRFRCLK